MVGEWVGVFDACQMVWFGFWFAVEVEVEVVCVCVCVCVCNVRWLCRVLFLFLCFGCITGCKVRRNNKERFGGGIQIKTVPVI